MLSFKNDREIRTIYKKHKIRFVNTKEDQKRKKKRKQSQP